MFKPKLMPLLEQCIENGLQLGWNRAHKHTDNPKEDIIFIKQSEAIFEELYEWFDIENTNEISHT